MGGVSGYLELSCLLGLSHNKLIILNLSGIIFLSTLFSKLKTCSLFNFFCRVFFIMLIVDFFGHLWTFSRSVFLRWTTRIVCAHYSRCQYILDLAILYCFSFSVKKDLTILETNLVEITTFSMCRRFNLVATFRQLLNLSNREIAYPIVLRDLLFQDLKMTDSSLNAEIVVPKGY